MGQLLISCAGNVVNSRAGPLFKHDDSGALEMNSRKRNSGRNKFAGPVVARRAYYYNNRYNDQNDRIRVRDGEYYYG